MSPGDKMRILRYHMGSGHVLQEMVDSALELISDDDLLDGISNVLDPRGEDHKPFIKIKELTSESVVLIRCEKIEMIQIGHAIYVADLGAAEEAEDSAIKRAQERWGNGPE